MQTDIKVIYLDGTSKIVTTRRIDAIKLERHVGQPIIKRFGISENDTSMFLEDVWFLAWSASKRADKAGVPDDFDEWAETVDDVEMIGDDEGDPAPLDRTA